MDRAIVSLFVEKGFQIHPDAIPLIKSLEGPIDKFVDLILKKLDPSEMVVTPKHLMGLAPALSLESTHSSRSSKPPSSTMPVSFEVIRGGKEVSIPSDGYKSFHLHFKNRFDQLSSILRGRVAPTPIGKLNSLKERECGIIGMVMDSKETANGNRMLELEDLTGQLRVIVSSNSEAYEESKNIMLDDVVGFKGTMRNGGLFLAERMFFGEIPRNGFHADSFSDSPSNVLFLSDLHIGSKTFLEKSWEKFVAWISGEFGDDNQRDLAENVQHILIAGDLIDGIGVYPGQEADLAILDVFEQYRQAKEYLDMIPERVKIVISPGNHDAVRQSEPQPPLPEKVRDFFDRDNYVFVCNPSLVRVGNLSVLIYHGRSLDDFIATLGLSYTVPELAMAEMLRRRHLAPTYGSRVLIAPAESDELVIKEIPNVLHCGHVHTVGVKSYNGVYMINSGTWQSQTEYQKRINIVPDPAVVPLMSLDTGRVQRLKFA